MPTGIDVGARSIRVATPEGTTRYSNEIRRVSDGVGADEAGDAADSDGLVTVETDDGVYVVDGAGEVDASESDSHGATDDTDTDSLGRLLGGASEVPPGVRGDVVEAFLAAILDDRSEEGDGGGDGDDDAGGETVRYVADSAGADPLAAVAAETGVDASPLDPGMAVCYDALDAPATGVGVAVTGDRAVATLAAGGVPVATASVPVDGDWYDLGDAADRADLATADGEGLASDWRARQAETLFADLGTALARTAPALGGELPVAVGGEAAPTRGTGRLAAALGGELPFDVGAVTVADDPASSLARGALSGAEADDGVEPPLPAFAVDVPFVGALADFRAATDALGVGAALSATAGGNVDADAGPDGAGGTAGVAAGADAGGAPGTAGDGSDPQADLQGAVAQTRADLAALDRRGAMTARGVSDLVERLDRGADGDESADGAAVEALRADVEALEAQLADGALDSLEGDLGTELDDLRAAVDALEADLERLDEEAATAAALADLEAAVESLDEAVAAVEDDTEKIRAALAGLDEESEIETPELSGEAVDALRADALQDEIDDLRAALDDRTEDVWTEVDDLDDRLVDVEATAGDVPDLESTVESTRNAVADLEDETATLRESVDDLRSSLADVTADTPSTADVGAVEADVERLRGDLDDLRAEFEGVERVDPATVEEIQTDLDGLRGTLISRADRLESLEGTTENLRERIETVYQNSAKSEALASVETEVARVRKTAAGAMERTNEMTETVSELDETVADHDEQLGMLSTNVDNLAGSAVTRPEMESDIRRIEERLDDLESDLRTEMEGIRSMVDQEADVEPVEEGGNELVLTLQTAAFFFLGALGAVLALGVYGRNGIFLAAAFVVFGIMPAILSWLVN